MTSDLTRLLHGTWRGNAESILTEGLEARTPDREGDHGVYLASDLWSCLDAISNDQGLPEAVLDGVIFEVDVTGLDVLPHGVDAWVVPYDIEPERIRLASRERLHADTYWWLVEASYRIPGYLR